MSVRNYRYQRIFFATYGGGPWHCDTCGELITEHGRLKHQGHIHHRNHDRTDDRPENLGIKHGTCHIRDHRTGTKASQETRERMSASHRGSHRSDETRKKMSDARRSWWAQRR